MTRIYDEVEIDHPQIGTGEDVYKFLIEKSSTGREFVAAIQNRDFTKMCFLSSRLGKIGYTDEELQKFFEFAFHTKQA